jgi:hypothetical protein
MTEVTISWWHNLRNVLGTEYTGCSRLYVSAPGAYSWGQSQSKMLCEHGSDSQWLLSYGYLKLQNDLYETKLFPWTSSYIVQISLNKCSEWPSSAWIHVLIGLLIECVTLECVPFDQGFIYVGSEALKVVVIEGSVFWDIMPCSLLKF